jgi:hypothetical protein
VKVTMDAEAQENSRRPARRRGPAAERAGQRDPKAERYRPRLVLVTIGSGRVVPLSGFQEPNDGYGDRDWEPVFAER